ncbi:MAG: hypothetical protein SVY41_00910 [Candidatus Nanohaloarchaea archaeon]|nr:hypothetical protein [Candidatus Nanohaloarchaea archaeon]
MAEVDYEEVVEGTIDEVKERVEEDDLDLEEVRAAEKANKDRVTLVDWLDEQMEESQAAAEEDFGAEDAGIVGGDSLPDRILAGVTSHLFIAGLVIGVAVALAVAPAGSGGAGMSAAGVSDSVETYFSQNTEGVPLEGVRVEQARQLQGSDLYQLDMVLSAKFLNRTVEQNQTAVVTSDARYLFLSQPIDTERPLAEQLGGARRQTQQPQQQ